MSGGHDRDIARCEDCGDDFARAYDAPITLCPLCCDRHDAHTTALEHRWTDARRMAKAALAALTEVKRKDVA